MGRIITTTLLLALGASAAFGQHDPKKEQVYVMQGIVVDGDTVPYKALPVVDVIGKGKFDPQQIDRFTRNIMKAYPYAKLTSETLQEMDRELAKISGKKERRKYIDWAEKQMKEAFEKDLKKLTYNQGRILIKLVNRETGKTSYELVKELKGSFSAFMWQGVAKLFGANLKSEFDPKNEDYIIEIVVNKIERGELPVAYIPRKSLVRNPTSR